jgi:hypothetical protein
MTLSTPPPAAVGAAFSAADIIIVSGGNTLYAVDRWRQLGVDAALRAALERGAVLAGGSAGAICWFDGGHSDSMDPDTYRVPMLAAAAAAQEGATAAAPAAGAAKAWQYIRIDGLGFLPGLVCPHHDRVQSNGVPRATDFDAMLLRHGAHAKLRGRMHSAPAALVACRARVSRRVASVSPVGRRCSSCAVPGAYRMRCPKARTLTRIPSAQTASAASASTTGRRWWCGATPTRS